MGKVRKASPAKKHADCETLRIAGMNVPMGPVMLHTYASDFLSAATLSVRTDVPFSPARTYLICHALELALKAFLSLKGRPLRELAGGELGHNLENLLDEAEQQGLSDLVQLEEPQIAEIRRASKYYAEKIFEYPALMEAPRAYPENPDANLLFGAAEALVAALQEPCE